MGCSNSQQMSESNKNKSLAKRTPMNKPESFYCFTDEEAEIIQSLLTENKYEPDDYISYMAYINLDEPDTTFKEIITIQTGKKDGQEYSGKFNFVSNIVKGKGLKTNVKINNIPIETIKQKENKSEYDCLEVEIDYNLKKNDNSIMTIELNTNSPIKMIYTDAEVVFICFDFRSPSSTSYFKLNAKCSSWYKYSNISRKPTNKLEEISPLEILLAGKEYEDNNTITFRNKLDKYDLKQDVINMFNTGGMELYSLNYALNSVGLNYGDTNIFGIKDIFNVSMFGECNAKSFIYIIHPIKPNSVLSTNFFLELEQNSLKLIDSKVNNTQGECTASKYGFINIPYSLRCEQFCIIELDYSFELRKIDDEKSQYAYNLCVNHKNLLDKGFYKCEINLRSSEYQIQSNGLFFDDYDEDREITVLRYSGFKFGIPLIMLNLKEPK